MSKTTILLNERDIQIQAFSYRHKEVWRIGDLSIPYWRLIHHNKGISELFFKKNIEKRRVSLPQGIIVIVPPEVEYSCSNTSPVDHLEVTFNISGPPLHVNHPYLSYPFEGEAKAAIKNLQEFPQTIKPELIRPFILNLLSYSASRMAIRRATGDERLNHAIVLMKNNPGRPLSNSYLAKESSMSVNGFARLFRQKMGRTPYNYQMKLRMDKACIMLQNSDKPIELIAEEAGFTNRFHFSKAFKNNQKMSPVQYRKMKS